eukprot:3065767-Rhodomonas_salina.1
MALRAVRYQPSIWPYALSGTALAYETPSTLLSSPPSWSDPAIACAPHVPPLSTPRAPSQYPTWPLSVSLSTPRALSQYSTCPSQYARIPGVNTGYLRTNTLPFYPTCPTLLLSATATTWSDAPTVRPYAPRAIGPSHQKRRVLLLIAEAQSELGSPVLSYSLLYDPTLRPSYMILRPCRLALGVGA